TDLDDHQRHYAETVRSSGEALLGLLNDILDYSKIEAGKLEMETINFDLRALLDDFAEMIAIRAHEKKLELVCAVRPEVPVFLQGDPGRLRQVLMNLVGNAIKFTDHGEIVIRASLSSETKEDATIRFSVCDTGIGIPREKCRNLFQQFTQVDASTTRKYGGTGLGLAISKQLSQLMGGKIGVASDREQGSEFWFTARFLKQPERLCELPAPTHMRDTRILIVDDNATNREILVTQLTAWGMRVDEANGGKTALRLLRNGKKTKDPYSLAIIDMQMPDMNGEELGRVIKADAELADTRLTMMTSLGLEGNAQRIKKIGFAVYLTKPVRRLDLFSSITMALSGITPQRKRPPIQQNSITNPLDCNARILLVEDNTTNQKVALGILKRKLGIAADVANNGVEAIEALKLREYDLVLMDCQMPEMDGYEATAAIRDPKSRALNRDIPIVAMTAHAMQGDRDKCLDAGMSDYLTKPIKPTDLIEMLGKWLPGESAKNKA
ncbi:MAG: response regulator, partial [Candidatus Hydrogenedentes bacterium]|nr:response regulator [Candidatus Hydrogenedentota bacterium]